MTLPRPLIVAQLASLSAEYQLIPYARDITPTRATVMVRIDGVSPTDDRMLRRYQAALLVITPRIDPTGPADDELDAALEDVLYSLDQTPAGIVWESARRVVYADVLPAYEIAITVHTNHTRGE